MQFYEFVIAVGIPGFLGGLASIRLRYAPIASTGLAVVLYAALLSAVGIWAARCWDCAHFRNSRSEVSASTS